MENAILIYNNSLNFNLKKTMNNTNDLLGNKQTDILKMKIKSK